MLDGGACGALQAQGFCLPLVGGELLSYRFLPQVFVLRVPGMFFVCYWFELHARRRPLEHQALPLTLSRLAWLDLLACWRACVIAPCPFPRSFACLFPCSSACLHAIERVLARLILAPLIYLLARLPARLLASRWADLQRVRGFLRLRPSRGGAEEEHQGRLVEGRGAGKGRHRRSRFFHHRKPEGKAFFMLILISVTAQEYYR